MTRFKLLLLAIAVSLAGFAAHPAASDACFIVGVCRACTPTTSQPCYRVTCGTKTTYNNCGSCTTNCVPPPD